MLVRPLIWYIWLWEMETEIESTSEIKFRLHTHIYLVLWVRVKWYTFEPLCNRPLRGEWKMMRWEEQILACYLAWRWQSHCVDSDDGVADAKIKGQSIDFHAFHLLPSTHFFPSSFSASSFFVCWFVRSFGRFVDFFILYSLLIAIRFLLLHTKSTNISRTFLSVEKSKIRSHFLLSLKFNMLITLCAGCEWNHLPKEARERGKSCR